MSSSLTSFLFDVRSIATYIYAWILNCSSLIRSNPFLLFTVGFVVLAYAIYILGRILSSG